MSDQTPRAVSSAAADVPVLRVEGHPSDEELAALVVVLSVVGHTPASSPASGRRSAWADPARRLVGVSPQAARRPSAPGVGWRDSALPG